MVTLVVRVSIDASINVQAHDIYYPTLVTYSEVVSNEAVGEGAAQVMMGKSLMFLQDLLIYVKRYART